MTETKQTNLNLDSQLIPPLIRPVYNPPPKEQPKEQPKTTQVKKTTTRKLKVTEGIKSLPEKPPAEKKEIHKSKPKKQFKKKFTPKKKQTKGKSKTKKNKLTYDRPVLGNGHHTAVCEVVGMLMPRENPPEDNQLYFIILSDGTQFPVLARSPRVRKAMQQDKGVGMHTFICYPRQVKGVITSLDLKGWGDTPRLPKITEKDKESWVFKGLWTKKNQLVVQRDLGMYNVRAWWDKTGKITTYHYDFENGAYYVKKGKLKDGELYELHCVRKRDQLQIKKVIPVTLPDDYKKIDDMPECIKNKQTKPE